MQAVYLTAKCSDEPQNTVSRVGAGIYQNLVVGGRFKNLEDIPEVGGVPKSTQHSFIVHSRKRGWTPMFTLFLHLHLIATTLSFIEIIIRVACGKIEERGINAIGFCDI